MQILGMCRLFLAIAQVHVYAEYPKCEMPLEFMRADQPNLNSSGP